MAGVMRGGGRLRMGRAGYVSVAVVLSVLLGVCAFAFGEGTAHRALQLLDGGVWVSDGVTGTATHINVAAARADAALSVVPAGVSVVEVINVDGDLVALGSDGAAYFISTADGTAQAESVMLDGRRVFAGRDWVYLIDPAAGTVTARPLGIGGQPTTTTLPPPLGAVAIDARDRLHTVLSAESAVAVIEPGSDDVRRIPLQASDRVALTRIGDSVASVDPGRGILTDLTTGNTRQIPKIDGDIIATGTPDWAVAVAGTRMVAVNLSSGRTVDLDLPARVGGASGTSHSPITILGGRAYVLDSQGRVHPVTLATSTIGAPIAITGGTIGEIIAAAGGIVFNDPNGPGALVVGGNGGPKPVNKGSAAASTAPPPPAPPATPATPNTAGPAAPAPGTPAPGPGSVAPPGPADPCGAAGPGCVYRPITNVLGYVTSPQNKVYLQWSYGPGDAYPPELEITGAGTVAGRGQTSVNGLPAPGDGGAGTYCVGARLPGSATASGLECIFIPGRPATWPIVGLSGSLSGDTVTLTWSFGPGSTAPEQLSATISGTLVWYQFGVHTSRSGLRAPAAGAAETYCVTAFHGARGDYSTQCVVVQGPPLPAPAPAPDPPAPAP